jgi:transcription-repair coupling factor (superfamily II helicase)
VAADNLLRISLLRSKAHALYIPEIKGGHGEIEIKVNPNARIDPGKIPGFIASYKGTMAFHSAGTPVFVYKYKKDTNPQKAGQKLLEDAEAIIDKMLELLI